MKQSATRISEPIWPTEPGLEGQSLNWLEQLPPEIVTMIAGFLPSLKDLGSLSRSSRKLYDYTRKIWLARTNQKSKKRYLQALQIHGKDTHNAVHFIPYIKNLREKNVDINWNKLYRELPSELRLHTTPQSNEIGLLKKQHPDWFRWIKENTSNANELLQFELNRLGPQDTATFTTLLLYAARRGCDVIVPTILEIFSADRCSPDTLYYFIPELFKVAATSRHGQPIEKQQNYTTLIHYILGKIHGRHWYLEINERAATHLKENPLSQCLMVVIAQGDLELYRDITNTHSNGARRNISPSPLIELIQDVLLKQAIAYGHLELVRHMVSEAMPLIHNEYIPQTMYTWKDNPADLVYFALQHGWPNIASALIKIKNQDNDHENQKQFKKAFETYILDSPSDQDDMIKDVLINFLFFDRSPSCIRKKQRKKPRVQLESLLWYVKATKHFSDLPLLPSKVERRVMMLTSLSIMMMAASVAIFLFFTVPLLPSLISFIALIPAASIFFMSCVLVPCLPASRMSKYDFISAATIGLAIGIGAGVTALFCLAPGLPTLINILGLIGLTSAGLIAKLFPISSCLGLGGKEDAIPNTNTWGLFGTRDRVRNQETQPLLERLRLGTRR